jgi:Mannosyltransferase (PIG-V)
MTTDAARHAPAEVAEVAEPEGEPQGAAALADPPRSDGVRPNATGPSVAPPAATRIRLGADVAVPMAIRAAGMAVQLAVLAWLNGAGGPSLLDRLTKWDGLFYAGIAESGYPQHVTVAADGTLAEGTEFAFHPLFPGLAGGLHLLGMPGRTAVVLVAGAAGLAAAVAVHLLTRYLLDSRRAGYIAVALLGVLPVSIALQMGYAESLYLAFAAATVLAALRGRWWLAAVFAFSAGLTRPTALALVVVIPLAAVASARRQRRAQTPNTVRWPSVVGASLVAAAGVPVYWAWLWIRTGQPTAWFTVEDKGWDSHFDFGAQTWSFVYDTLRAPDGFLAPVVSVIIIGYVLATVLLVLGRWPAPLTGVVLLSVAIPLLSTNYWHSKPRLLLAGFLLVIPAAGALRRFRGRTAAILLAAGTAASAWFGAYLLVVWPYAI